MSKRGSGQQTGFIAKSALGASGEEIDLSDYPLRYGEIDGNLVGKPRETIEQFEDARWKNKIEFSRFVDSEGNVIEDNRGGTGSVKASYNARLTADVMTHNHPRQKNEKGCLGGTFSTGDLNNFARFNQTTYRATASEGTYSISKTKSFNKNSFASYVARENKKNYSAYKDAIASLGKKYRDGALVYSDYVTKAHKAFNAYLVDEHNSLIAGQKEHGYTYTLERRKK